MSADEKETKIASGEAGGASPSLFSAAEAYPGSTDATVDISQSGTGPRTALDPRVSSELLGKCIGRYQLEAVIGHGGMGVVYRARHQILHKTAAVKMLHPHLVGTSNNLARFKQEAEAASSLSHPNIIAVHDCGVTEEGRPFIIMDYLEGHTLAEILSEGMMPVERIVRIFMQASDALDHAHRKGIVHRDLKPSNIVVIKGEDGVDEIRIVDFGIAKVLGDAEVRSLTQTGEAIGSPQYMSPEQCLGQKLDARSDIYSLGCMLYEAFAAQPTCTGDSVFELMYKQLNVNPPSFKERRPDFADIERYEAIVFKAIAKDPKDRYQSMADFKDALALASGGERSFAGKVKDKLELLRLSLMPRQKDLRHNAILACAFTVLLGVCGWTTYSLVAPPDVPLQSVRVPLWPPFPDHEVRIGADPENTDAYKVIARGVLDSTRSESNYNRIKGQEIMVKQSLARGLYAQANTQALELLQEVSGSTSGLGKSMRDGLLMPIHHYLAKSAYYCQDYVSARSQYEHTIKLISETFRLPHYRREPALLYTMLGDCYYQKGQFEPAYADFKEALTFWKQQRENSDRALYFSKLGDVAAAHGDYEQARSYYEQATQDWAQTSHQDEMLGLAWLGRARTLQSWSQISPSPESYDRMREADAAFAKAVKILRDAAPNSQALASALKYQADLLWKRGRHLDSFLANYEGNKIIAKIRAQEAERGSVPATHP